MHCFCDVRAMTIKYEQDGGTRCVVSLWLWDEDCAELFFTQEVISPSILRYANAVLEQKVNSHQFTEAYLTHLTLGYAVLHHSG